MLSFLADENIHGDIVRALLRASPTLDLVRAQDVGLAGSDDPTILAWAADAGRVLLTHDLETMIAFAYDRVRADTPMPGIVVIRQSEAMRTVVEDILMLANCSQADEWAGQVLYLPLR